jgi:hypothetical protein
LAFVNTRRKCCEETTIIITTTTNGIRPTATLFCLYGRTRQHAALQDCADTKCTDHASTRSLVRTVQRIKSYDGVVENVWLSRYGHGHIKLAASSYSSSTALRSIADPRLLNGRLPDSFVFWRLFPVVNFVVLKLAT